MAEENQKEEPKIDPNGMNEVTQPDNGEVVVDGNSMQGDQKGKKIILILIPLVLILIGAATYFFLVYLKKANSAEINNTHTTSGNTNTSTDIFADFDNITAALMVVNQQKTFIKVSFTIQLAKEEDLTKLNQNRNFILDAIQTFLHEVRPDDISGPAGLLLLRRELTKRINKIIAPTEVKDILFKELFMA